VQASLVVARAPRRPLPPLPRPLQEPGGPTQALRLYGVIFGVVVALMETEWQAILAWCRFAENWIARGSVQAFIAVVTMEVGAGAGGPPA
jgi:hypothetical protein